MKLYFNLRTYSSLRYTILCYLRDNFLNYNFVESNEKSLQRIIRILRFLLRHE